MKALPRLIPSKIRYRFDNWLAWSPFARFLFVLIFGAFALGLGVTLLKLLAPDSEPAQDLLESLWWAWGRVADPGTGSDDQGRGMRTASVVTTFAGLCVFVLLIGFVAGYVQDKINELRQTGAPVGEEGHTLILGFGDKTLNLIEEISIANGKRHGCVVILSSRPKDEVIGAILDRFGANKVRRTRIVVREGSSSSPNDLVNVAVLQAASVIVLSDDGPTERGDVRVVKTLLAMLRGLPVRIPGRVVVELEDPQRLDVVKAIDDHGSVLVVSRDFLGRLMVQTARQAGLAAVYGSLLSFEGDEFYLMAIPSELVGKTFHDAWSGIAAGVVAGVLPAGETKTILAPSDDRVLGEGDRLLVLLEDDVHGLRVESAASAGRKAKKKRRGGADERRGGPSSVTASSSPAQRVVILGYKQDLGTIVAELDQFLGEGSAINVLSELPTDDCLRRLRASLPVDSNGAPYVLKNVELAALQGDTTSRASVEEACAGRFDAAIVLADDLVGRDPDASDARTLMSLLLLQNCARTSQPTGLAERSAEAPRTVAEIRNPATKELITAARVGDFVVSDELVSQLLAHVSRTPELASVWSDLCSAEGYEIYMKPLGLYAADDESLSFMDLQARARARSELVLGWSLEGEVELNPKDKFAPRRTTGASRAIVLADH